MTLTIQVPDGIAATLQAAWADLRQAMLESLAVEGYRTGKLSPLEVRTLLGHDSRWETEDFLASHGVWPGTTADEVAADGRKLNALLNEQ